MLHATCSVDLPVDAMAEPGGEVPLIIAARAGHSDCLRCLLDFGADLTAKTHDGKAALYCAALEGNLSCIYTLHAAGCDVEASDDHGFRALHGAALNGQSQCVEALLQMGAKVDAPINDGKTAAYLVCTNLGLGFGVGNGWKAVCGSRA